MKPMKRSWMTALLAALFVVAGATSVLAMESRLPRGGAGGDDCGGGGVELAVSATNARFQRASLSVEALEEEIECEGGEAPEGDFGICDVCASSITRTRNGAQVICPYNRCFYIGSGAPGGTRLVICVYRCPSGSGSEAALSSLTTTTSTTGQ